MVMSDTMSGAGSPLADIGSSHGSPLRVGFYEIEATIGRGNFAVVKLARHRITKTEVGVRLPVSWAELFCLPGCHQDYWQVPTGPQQPGQGVPGGGGDEAGEPPQHCEALPSDGDQEHALSGVWVRAQGRNIWSVTKYFPYKVEGIISGLLITGMYL